MYIYEDKLSHRENLFVSNPVFFFVVVEKLSEDHNKSLHPINRPIVRMAVQKIDCTRHKKAERIVLKRMSTVYIKGVTFVMF